MTAKQATRPPGSSRRERVRSATLREILEVARRLLAEDGEAAISLRAIAREMGMTAPALYRYYPSHTDLVVALTADIYDELTAELIQARDAVESSDPLRRLHAVAHRLRDWARSHPAEFGLVFASPVPKRFSEEADGPDGEAGVRFGTVFRDLTAELWRTRPFPTPDLATLHPSLRAQLDEYSSSLGGELPPEAAYVFLTTWIRLYGPICMEVFGQLRFAFQDVEPMFEECLRDLTALLGGDYVPPAG